MMKTSGALDQPLLSVEGWNTSFAVFEDRIVVRGSLRKFFLQAPSTDLTILIAHISAIRFKAPGRIPGSGVFSLMVVGQTIFDKFLVTFSRAQQPAFEQAKALIEDLMRRARR